MSPDFEDKANLVFFTTVTVVWLAVFLVGIPILGFYPALLGF
jgi:uncharacterized membrane protein YesL